MRERERGRERKKDSKSNFKGYISYTECVADHILKHSLNTFAPRVKYIAHLF